MSKEEKQHKEDNFLMYIPKKKHNEWEVKNGKVYLIFHHDKAIERFMRWLVKKPTVSDMELDDVGSAVWQLIDGSRSVYDIGMEIKNQFGDKCEPVFDRLIMYMRFLNRKAWVSFERGDQNRQTE